uniref:FtsJ domain-containing protein n=1 Tax=Steinernema glaseri TaxID=37863 RepID=A0A1I7YCE6_9BILA
MIPTYELILDRIFEKRFDLKLDGVLASCEERPSVSSGLPDCLRGETTAFETVYEEVDSLKRSEKPPEWHNHTIFTHAMKNLSRELRKQRGVPHASQAYCKLMELFQTNPEMGINAFEGAVFRSLHLCEAPGAFIRATIDHLPRSTVQWTATSLNPYFEWNDPEEMFVEDEDDMVFRFPERWNFGRSGSGDVFEARSEDFEEGAYDLVTADGSLNCDTIEKEIATHSLLRAEADIALHALRQGGDLVLKMYSWRSEEMRSLLDTCVKHFRTVRICKPIRVTEIQVYLVCCSYSREEVPHSPQHLNDLLLAAARFFIDHQIRISIFNWDSYFNWSQKLQHCILAANRSATSTWIEMFVPGEFVPTYKREALRMDGQNFRKPWEDKETILETKLWEKENAITIYVDWQWEWTLDEDVTFGIVRSDKPVINSLFVPDRHQKDTDLVDLGYFGFPLKDPALRSGPYWITFLLECLQDQKDPFVLDLSNFLLLSRLSASVVGALCSAYRTVTLRRDSITFSGKVDLQRLELLRSFLSAVSRVLEGQPGRDLLSFLSIRKMAEATFYSILLMYNEWRIKEL